MDAYKNFSISTVSVAPSPADSGTTLTVSFGDGTKFPAVPFNAVVHAFGELPVVENAEIIRVTNISGDDFTIDRTQEGSSARTILAGDQIYASPLTKKGIDDLVSLVGSPTIVVSAGGTSDSLSGITFANSNGVSFGLNGSTITATVATNYQSQGAYLTTAMASNRGSDFVAASAAFAGTNASGTIASNGISVSVAAPGGGVTGISGLIASDATYSSGSVYFSGQNNVTIGSSVDGDSQYVRFSVGNYLTTAMASNRGSDFVAATATVAGTNITGTISSNVVSLSVAAQSNQSAIKGFGVSNTGATAGNTGISTGIDWVLAGSGAITLSQSTTAGGPNTVWVQPAAWLTTAMASNRGSDFVQATAGFNGTNASGTIASNSMSVSVAAPIPIATAVKAVASVGSTGTITRYAPEDHQHAGVAAFAVTNTGQTAGNTRSQVGTLYLAGSGSITLSQSTGANGNDTVWWQHPAWLTTAMASNRGSDFVQASAAFNGTNASGTIASNAISVSVAAQTHQTLGLYMSSNTTSSVSSGTVDARSLTFRGMGVASVGYSGGEVVVSVPSGGGGLTAINASAGTTSNNLSAVTFADSNGISFGINASTITASANTVGTATTYYPVASANSVGTVTRWAAEDHRHAGIGGMGISTSGNTMGTTGSQVGTYWFQGANNVTLSQITSDNGSHTLVISGGPMLSTYCNVPAFLNMVTGGSAITQTSGSSLWVQPFLLPHPISAGYLRLLASFNDSAVGTGGTPVANSTFSVERYTTIGMILLSQGIGANSLSLQYVTSTSVGLTGRSNVGAAAQSSRYTMTLAKTYPATGVGNNQYTTSYAVSSASIVISSNSNTLFTGPRWLDIPWADSVKAGNYWLAIGASTNSATQSANIAFATTAGMAMSLAGLSQSNVSVGILGAVTSASWYGLFPGAGVWTTDSAILSTSSIAISQVSQVASNPILPFQILRQA